MYRSVCFLAIAECDGLKRKCKSYAYCQTKNQHNFCRCLFGYTGDGKICEGEYSKVEPSLCLAMTMTTTMTTIITTTITTIITELTFQNLNIILIYYLDVNECATYDNLCESNANCINTVGSYRCVCKDGFQLNKDICEKGIFSQSFLFLAIQWLEYSP